MKTLIFAKRNIKEMLREPLNLVFMLALPLLLLIIFQQFNIPAEVYSIENFTPSIAVFSFGFLSLFSGLLISKDRTSSLLSRLYSSPLTSFDFIAGYSLSMLPIAVVQSILFYVCAICLGLTFSINVLLSILVLILISFLFIAFGILLGSLFSEKTVPGITSLLINLIGFGSGMWFDLSIAGKLFEIICRILPFSHAVDLSRNALSGNYSEMIIPLLVVIAYIAVTYVIAVVLFKKKMKY